MCAEWELGGYPAWLLADPALVLRSTDEKFTRPAERWLARLGRELAPLLSSAGLPRRSASTLAGAKAGPIIAVQLENEYGSFDKDKAYLEWHRRALLDAGFGGALVFTADGDVQLPNGTLDGVPAVVNFGVGGAENAFKRLGGVPARRAADDRRVLGRLVRPVGSRACKHQPAAADARTRLDARARLLDQLLHVPRRHDARLHERREHRQRPLLPADVELRLRRGARRVGPA